MLRAGFIICVLLTLVTGVVFAVWPDLDLQAARYFHVGEKAFSGVSPAGDWARRVGYLTPFVILIGAFGIHLIRRRKGDPDPRPAGRTLLFLALGMALAPGLMANLVFKDHWHRPRPIQTTEFGGTMEFRPWYRTDGACKRNCSFVSGEGSSAFWTLAPAMVSPPPVRPYAVVASLVFGASVSVLRMAYGGHYLSDVIFAALFTMLIVLGLHRIMFSPARR
jgi:lipid A 4'-phosphatase